MIVYTKSNKDRFDLTNNNFLASGGEASVYIIGSKCYKVFHKNIKLPEEGKLKELSVIKNDRIIVPIDVLVDSQIKNIVGFTMNAVKGQPLTKFLSPKIRKRQKIPDNTILQAITQSQKDLHYIHSKDILVVDLSDMNLLMSDDGRSIYYIDTTTYKTPSYQPTAITMHIKDYLSDKFTEMTDWFSFGIVTFNMLTGIHPYRGFYKPLDGSGSPAEVLEKRMREGISVFAKGVELPPSVTPFSQIPSGYLEWYKSLFLNNNRAFPPADPQAKVEESTSAPVISKTGSLFNIELIGQFPDEILSVNEDLVFLVDGSVFRNNVKLNVPFKTIGGFYDSDRKACMVFGIGTRDINGEFELVGYNVDKKETFNLSTKIDQVGFSKNTLFVKLTDTVYSGNFYFGQRTIMSLKKVADVMPLSTKLYGNVIYQNILGKGHITICSDYGRIVRITPDEIQSKKILDIQHSNNILVVLASSGGEIYRYIYKFRDEKYSVHVDQVTDTSLNLAVLDNGVAMIMEDSGQLLVFSTNPSSKSVSTLRDISINNWDLYAIGSKACASVGNKLYYFSIKK